MNKGLSSKEGVNINDNCFTLIRYLAALQVLAGHCIKHFSLDTTSLLYRIYEHTLGMVVGVPVFFGLTGFLIWSSLDRNDELKTYAQKRIKRLYPQLWLAVSLNAAAILILYGEAVKGFQFVLFCITQSTFLQFWTPDSLRGYGCSTPNGSLWTISTYVQFYILAYPAYRWYKKANLRKGSITKRTALWIIIMLASLVFSVGYPRLEPFLPETLFKLAGQTIFPYLGLFITGVIVYEFRNTLIPPLAKFWYVPLSLYYFIRIYNIDLSGTYINPLAALLLLLSVFAVGYKFGGIKIKRDYTYGIYLYHMILVNIIIQTRIMTGLWAMLAVIIGSFALAYISSLIEDRLFSGKKKIRA
ncbi:MAG: acyltransferase [Eubacteriaceae bacterium]|nr:acyltransferase [Eubacteriaceae bacterium]